MLRHLSSPIIIAVIVAAVLSIIIVIVIIESHVVQAAFELLNFYPLSTGIAHLHLHIWFMQH